MLCLSHTISVDFLENRQTNFVFKPSFNIAHVLKMENQLDIIYVITMIFMRMYMCAT